MCFWFRVLCVISMLVWLIFVGISGRFAARAPGTSDAVFHQEEQEDFHVLLVSQLDAKWVLFIWINCYFWCFYCLYDEGLFKLEYIVFFLIAKLRSFLDELPCICNLLLIILVCQLWTDCFLNIWCWILTLTGAFSCNIVGLVFRFDCWSWLVF